ncbi:hypothetical protein [Enterococcus cecorum]|uniref:hypothetical protein n=1 Tax=Enterococcus cecorum TaxID=44008 RepID=UPI00200B1820|nr:hypothetical protein [Enterococcus cecorum]
MKKNEVMIRGLSKEEMAELKRLAKIENQTSLNQYLLSVLRDHLINSETKTLNRYYHQILLDMLEFEKMAIAQIIKLQHNNDRMAEKIKKSCKAIGIDFDDESEFN